MERKRNKSAISNIKSETIFVFGTRAENGTFYIIIVSRIFLFLSFLIGVFFIFILLKATVVLSNTFFGFAACGGSFETFIARDI